ncbi:MAG: asparagine synthase (glutamine-hydrolyzing) [Elusimicrobia bacterium]|nr:asparagine synthase (glutamine-hydrolyzing) [Elusimicrobiota bacterium]
MGSIAGIVALEGRLKAEDKGLASSMLSELGHRGAKFSGSWSDGRVALACAGPEDGLSFPDHPFSSSDGSLRIAVEGQITNHLELRKSLKQGGAFSTKHCAETLMRLYQEEGIDCLRRTTGMFAFAIYDVKAGKVYAGRDHFGIRPLFWMRKNGRLYFGSQLKCFMELPEFRRSELDLEALFHYFSLAYIPGEFTPFKDVRELLNSHLIEIDLATGKDEIRPYYTIDHKPDPGMDENAAADGLRSRMEEALLRNIPETGPVGLTVSGGVDTSTLLMMYKKLTGGREIHTFSASMSDGSFDESRYQHFITKYAGSIHHEVKVGPNEIIDNLYRHVAFLDEPSGDGACIPFFLLSRAASEYAPVLLTGEGGDTVFKGYETFRAYKVRKYYRKLVPSALRQLVRKSVESLPVVYKKLSLEFMAKRFVQGCEMDTPQAHLYWRYTLRDFEKRGLMPLAADGVQPTDSLFAKLFYSLDYPDELNRISAVDFRYYLMGDMLLKNDRMLSSHGVDPRVPYLDRRLVEFANSVPTELKLKGMSGRYIQKKAVKDLLPAKIYRRKNMGLELAHSRWFHKEMLPLAQRYFSKESIEKTGFVDPTYVKTLWEEHVNRKIDHGRALWCLLTMLVWMELFVYSKDYKGLLGRQP